MLATHQIQLQSQLETRPKIVDELIIEMFHEMMLGLHLLRYELFLIVVKMIYK